TLKITFFGASDDLSLFVYRIRNLMTGAFSNLTVVKTGNMVTFTLPDGDFGDPPADGMVSSVSGLALRLAFGVAPVMSPTGIFALIMVLLAIGALAVLRPRRDSAP